ncbi:CDP-glucose 4,6-dehydratase [Tenacibaculum sp. SG-28]|uniref:CDP-glucose 4,6-dehydratase n=1 Tax=Tenacibaculum sp. SG-28 TaxID=754426 RepID=UPI000CF41392|nr:CDP-glucose 4,6-dehydratase [Tenacibaculum sp. SG-28]PQJ21107.1 CDP-glucose 4,6-dehydratase [Tenacibaculum sp. SG-28]
MFSEIYKGKKVLVTGHTGFKGTWLTSWLLKLEASVIGVSREIPTQPSMFEELNLEDKITHYIEDVVNLKALKEIVFKEKPDFVFHLAAQPIVSLSYSDPIDTINSNVIGTTNILESLRKSNHNCTVVMITSDKAYDNVEQIWGYKENDHMGGKDIYSGSKGAAELIIKSYYNSFFQKPSSNVRLAIGRAGNVIGGGDWAKDRIVVDCMLAWSKGAGVEIRSPKATRPWQHVLEPLSGYLKLGLELYNDKKLNGEGFNFGPRAEQNRTVQQLLEDLSECWSTEVNETFRITDNIPFHEAGLLKLNCDKALAYLKWQATLEYHETIKFTSEWYYNFYKKDIDILDFTLQQIQKYEELYISNSSKL